MPAKLRHERRKAKEQRGLRILRWVACLFVLAQLLGGLLLDYVWVRPRHPMQADTYAMLKARRHPPEILFLGSSRFGGDVNCAVMDAELRLHLGEGAPRTFNAGLPGADGTIFERVFDDVTRTGYRPKLVVVEIDPGTVSGRDNWLYQHALNILDWRDAPETAVALGRNGRIMYLVRGRLVPLYLHNYQIRKESAKLIKSMFVPAPAQSLGDPPVLPPVLSDPVPPPMTAQVKARQDTGFIDMTKELKGFHLHGMATRRIERLLARCQLAGIRVLLVGVPAAEPHRRPCTPEVNAALLGYMATLSERYGCTFTDWRDRVPDIYFADQHHTFYEGGIYFSRHFVDETLAPYWRERYSTQGRANAAP